MRASIARPMELRGSPRNHGCGIMAVRRRWVAPRRSSAGAPVYCGILVWPSAYHGAHGQRAYARPLLRHVRVRAAARRRCAS